MKEYKKYIPIAIVAFIFYLATLYWKSAINLINIFIGASSTLIFGFMLAYVVNLLMVKYEGLYIKIFKTERFKRAICLLLSYLTLVLALAIIIAIITPQIINALTIVIRDGGKALMPYLNKINKIPALSTMGKDLQKIISGNSNISSTVTTVARYVLSGASNVIGVVTSAVSSFLSILTTITFAIIFSTYLLGDKETLIAQFKRVINIYLPKFSKHIFYVGEVFNNSYKNFIIGQVTEAIIIGVLCAIGCMLLNLPYASMCGTIVGVTALIPIAGAYIGGLLSAFLIFTVNPLSAVEFLVFIIILQQIEDNLIYPKVVGTSLGLPGIWVLASITIFGGVFGFPGMVFGVPMASGIYTLIQNDLRKRVKNNARKSSKA